LFFHGGFPAAAFDRIRDHPRPPRPRFPFRRKFPRQTKLFRRVQETGAGKTVEVILEKAR